MGQVKIGPDFFKNTPRDYRDYKFAIIREFGQNSLDAGCTQLNFDLRLENGDTRLIVTNNGEPMTEGVLVNKLLALGGTTKTGMDGVVGGFGCAKLVLYFMHQSYHIHSGEHVINGSGADYEHTVGEFFNGTKSIIVLKGDLIQDLSNAVKRFCAYAQVDAEIILDTPEETLTFTPNLKKGSPRRELDFGTVYTNKSASNILIVRIGGIPMFKSYCDIDRCVILELNGKSSDVLTSNRDGLTGKYQEALNNFLTEIAVDKKSALKDKKARYRHYSGTRYGHHTQKALNVKALVGNGVAAGTRRTDMGGSRPTVVDDPSGIMAAAALAAANGTEVNHDLNARTVTVIGEVPYTGYVPPSAEFEEVVSPISEEFVIKNETDLAVPKYYLPDSGEFCTYAQKLAKIWGRLMLELHRMTDREDSFAIGFLFDEDSAAEHENGDYGRVYYLNPATIVKQDCSQSRSFKKRFALTERDRLISIAAHEFVHGLGFDWHDESYAGRLTELFAQVMKERKRFNWCFNE